tara:strand:+ start:135 stop:386 length:252 start_codon:yes stop_codon:yes gene_type:complete
MSEADKSWTFTADEGTYSVDKFTDEGKLAFNLLIETDKELKAAQKTVAKLNMALKGFNAAVVAHLTEDMLAEEKEPEPLESMD